MNMQELSPAVHGKYSPFCPSIQSSPSQCRQLIGGAEKKSKSYLGTTYFKLQIWNRSVII